MAINTGLASLSEGLWTAATGTYMLAVVAYTGEYAFGRNGRIASTTPAAAVKAVKEPALVGASSSDRQVRRRTARASVAGRDSDAGSALGSVGRSR